MMQTELTPEQVEHHIGQLAHWAASLRIGTLVAFLLEINRPLAPLTANACIAFGPLASGLLPLPLHNLGLLLNDDAAVRRLCARIREEESIPPPETHSQPGIMP